MASAAAEARSGERVVRLCQSVVDARALRQQSLRDPPDRAVRCVRAWLLTDPETSVGSSPQADVPCLSELSTLIRLKYLTEVNRWTRMETAVGLLAEATDGDLARSLVWRDLQHRFDVVDVVSVVFRDAFGCWGFLDLWRSHALGRFTSADAAYLGGIAAPVSIAWRRSQGEDLRRARRGAAESRRARPRVEAVRRACRARTDPGDPGVPTGAGPAELWRLADSGRCLQRRRAAARRRGGR